MILPVLFREPVLVLATFALGFGVTVFAALAEPDPGLARATFSVWPALLLGGVAGARMIRRGPGLEGTGWLPWWAAGLLAYVLHLVFGFWGSYGGSLPAALAGQGLPTVALNFGLLALWSASVAAAVVPREPLWEQAMHGAASLAFAVAALGSTLAFGDHPVSRGLGALVLALWLHALWRRFLPR